MIGPISGRITFSTTSAGSFQPRGMHLRDRSRGQRLLIEIVEPGFQRAAHRQFDMFTRQRAVERRDPVLQQSQLIGNLRRKQIAAGRHHLAELDPDRPQFLQRQPQAFTSGLSLCRFGIQNSSRRPKRSGSVKRILGISSSSP